MRKHNNLLRRTKCEWKSQVDRFEHLGNIITATGKSTNDIKKQNRPSEELPSSKRRNYSKNIKRCERKH